MKEKLKALKAKIKGYLPISRKQYEEDIRHILMLTDAQSEYTQIIRTDVIRLAQEIVKTNSDNTTKKGKGKGNGNKVMYG